nr:UDP-N-acetylglucosamine 2-epimerase (hydrolyzing) [Nanoarchaeum sp.]
MRKICVVSGYRSDYTKLKSVLSAIKNHPELELQLVVAAAHLLGDYGKTIEIIKKDGFEINAIARMVVEGEDPHSMTKSVGLGILEITTLLDNLKPDIVLIVGDRFEMLSVAISASLMNIPLAHIQGGEVSGTIDESIRHAITKFAHIHFPSTEQSAKRIIKMGENPSHVYNVGCPSMDEILKFDLGKKEDIKEIKYLEKFDSKKPFLLVAQHPVTTEFESSYEQMYNTLEAIQETGIQTVLLYPNPDAGSADMVQAILEHGYKTKEKSVVIKKFKNLPFATYIKLLAHCDCLIGNSSSGIRESHVFGTPVINVGTRQKDRERGKNVIDVNHNKEEIKEAILKCLSKGKLECEYLYGTGDSGKKIADILSKIELKNIVQKKISY